MSFRTRRRRISLALLALAGGLGIGANPAFPITTIAKQRLVCDVAKAKSGSAAKPVPKACVRRPGKKLPRSVVRKEFPRFSAQRASDPRVRVDGGRRLVSPEQGRSIPSVRSHTSLEATAGVGSRQPVSPVLECVSRDGARFLAHFGYSNKNASRVEIAIGGGNKFVPGGDLGQPTLFASGRLVDVFQVPFSGGNLVWVLDGRTATASPNSKPCPAPPAPTFFADQFAVVALDANGGGAEYHGLRTVGVPTLIAPSITEAVKFKVVLLAGAAAPGLISAEDIERLRLFVAGGGILIAESVTDERIYSLIGVSGSAPSPKRSALDWVSSHPSTAELDRPSERHVDIDDRFGSIFTTTGYAPGAATEVLATFDDGTAAVTRRAADAGTVYALGGTLTDLVTRHHEGARWSAKARYENAFDTSADGWLLWLRGVYRTHVAGGVTLSTAPEGKRFAVLPTLSLNFSAGVGPVVDYVAKAEDRDVTPTVFVWTKTQTDWLDIAFFSDSGPFDDVMTKIRTLGAEIGAHTVAHSPVFHTLPMGSGTESAAGYRPFVHSKTKTTDASVLGEVRVSRQLIQARLNPKATSFRAGYLLTTPRLAVAEEAAGVRDDSSTTQGWVGGALPFSIPRFDRAGYADVTTYPIAIEDERGTRIDRRIDEARDLMEANGDNGAPTTILFHPNGWEWKLKAWDKLLMQIPSDAWSGTVQQFGDFWQDRSRAALVTSPSTACGGGRHVEISSLNAAWPVRGQVLDVPTGLSKLVLGSGEVRNVNSDGKVILPDIAGGAKLVGELCP
jgi:hypothetical protein